MFIFVSLITGYATTEKLSAAPKVININGRWLYK
jgi:hypothetical protein